MEQHKCINGCCVIKVKPYYSYNNYYETNKIKKKAGMFIYDPVKRKILIVQSRGNFWGLPKGTLNQGEQERDCAIREVKEETGLIIDKDEFKKATKIRNRAIYFYVEKNECQVKIQENIIDNDVNGIGWINIDCLESSVKNGNITLNKHCKIVFERFMDIIFDAPSDWTVIKK